MNRPCQFDKIVISFYIISHFDKDLARDALIACDLKTAVDLKFARSQSISVFCENCYLITQFRLLICKGYRDFIFRNLCYPSLLLGGIREVYDDCITNAQACLRIYIDLHESVQ